MLCDYCVQLFLNKSPRTSIIMQGGKTLLYRVDSPAVVIAQYIRHGAMQACAHGANSLVVELKSPRSGRYATEYMTLDAMESSHDSVVAYGGRVYTINPLRIMEIEPESDDCDSAAREDFVTQLSPDLEPLVTGLLRRGALSVVHRRVLGAVPADVLADFGL